MTTDALKTIQVPAQRAEAGAGLVGAARGGLANLAGAVIAAIAGVGVTWLVARTLGAEQAGSFFAATSAFVLTGSIARLGTSTALVYWPARLRAQGHPELIRACLRAGLIPVAVLGTVLGVALWFAAPHLFPHYQAPLRVLAVFLPMAALADSLLAATRGYRMMRPTVILDKITRSGGQLLGIGLLALFSFKASVTEWALAWVLPYTIVFVAAAVLIGRKVPRSVPTRGMSREFWRFTAPRAVASAAQTALQRVDVMLVAALAGLVPAAAYAVAGRFIVVGQLANGAISQSVQPRLAESLSIGDKASAQQLYQTATAWLVLLCWPLHLLVLNYAPFYLGVFGPDYVAAAPAVRVLALGMLVGTGCGMVDIVLSMAGRTTWNLLNVLAALITMITIDLLTIRSLGALGAAIGLASAVVVNNLLPLAQLGFSLGLHPFGQQTLTAMGLAVVCFGLIPFLLTGVTGAIAGVASYAIGLRLLYKRLDLAVILAARRRRAR